MWVGSNLDTIRYQMYSLLPLTINSAKMGLDITIYDNAKGKHGTTIFKGFC